VKTYIPLESNRPSTKFMKAKQALYLGLLLIATAFIEPASAQTTYTENFTNPTTTNSWFFLNGACLTAGTTGTSTAANPSCVGLPYYPSKGDNNLKGGTTGTLPDAVASGALRFTNSYGENGAILSNFNFPLSSQGLQVSFTTVTYEGDSGGAGGDGADGISFFLQDATYPADVGAFGGSLAYTCSNTNNDPTLSAVTGQQRGFDGIAGGYIGLGIDEYGNFLNQGDNTASGWGYQPGRIGLRGSGSVNWRNLNATYPAQYPSTLTAAQRAAAVQTSCTSGNLWDFSSGTGVAVFPSVPLQFTSPGGSKYGDYPAIPTAFKVLPSTQPIANESATMRSQAVPITYNLKITPTGLLSLSYSYNGGANQAVITSVDITQPNSAGVPQNPLPPSVRFGFAGSTGGSTNIHEIMCFQATPTQASASSAGVNQRQSARVQTGTQLYLAFFNPQNWGGSLTSQYIDQSTTDANSISIDSTINWDGSCVLTGVPSGQTCDTTGPAGPIAAQAPGSRVIYSWNGTTGIPFEWSSLSSGQQSALTTGDSTPTPLRLNYLRGDRTQEQVPATATTFTGIFRDRTSVLGDIIDSAPTWVGPPNLPWPDVWVDILQGTSVPFPENSGQHYSAFSANGTVATHNERQRTNVVYAGANDGMLHGFRSGSFNSSNTFVGTQNDGLEVMAYVPGNVVNNIQSAVTTRNFSDPQYGHKFDVDAPPGTGDIFYGGLWHTWLVGGLGPGGKAIYALDVTDPDSYFTSEGNAGTVVKGEWDNNSISCVGNGGCKNSLGNTYGVPVLRRFHNGKWGAIFGNGYGSSSGDAGIFVMLVDSTSGSITFYYLSTGVGSSGTPNGISYVTAADFDTDHITDFVYGGDLQGNMWRFDLTSTNPANWAVTPNPVFKTPGGQPITTAPLVLSIPGPGTLPHIMIEFGTGRQVPMTNTSAATYQTTAQSLYGIWDWNLTSWNALAGVQHQFATKSTSLPSSPTAAVVGTSTLQAQTITSTSPGTVTGAGSDFRTVSSNPVCFADVSGCSQYGWFLTLTSGNAFPTDPAVPQTSSSFPTSPTVYEQIIFNPSLIEDAFVINTFIPPATSATSCFNATSSGWTMALNPATGGAFQTAFFLDANHNGINAPNGPATGLALGGTGTASSMLASGGQGFLITQTGGTSSGGSGGGSAGGGSGVAIGTATPGLVKGKRLTWIQKR
jgi:type IV pilus assembly protein PilY1